ncbi:39S ribosomal protein L42, mitochondrial, partial [Plectropomus leopardus]|uniref:39S ribosomal protein L42, mitochondrial n=1 Tax=Plectropomus leopardus TaxID=160734 RepID=UPI001C4BF1B7
MAAGRLCKIHSLLTRLSAGTTQRHAQSCLVSVRQKSSVTGPSPDSPNCNVEIGVTSDGKTIVCYHPTVDVPYELTQVRVICSLKCQSVSFHMILMSFI